LEQYAATLAAEHQVSDRLQRGRLLLPRFEENGRQLISAYCTLAEAVFQWQEISPAAKWLVDNFHIVEQQLRQICEDLPKSYYYQLHKLSAGEMRGYPRICSIALAFIMSSHRFSTTRKGRVPLLASAVSSRSS
jgi:cyclic beta-1,2-glucan glucanotransferase